MPIQDYSLSDQEDTSPNLDDFPPIAEYGSDPEAIDTSAEIRKQYIAARQLQTESIHDESVPADKIANIIRTTSITLAYLVKVQTDLYNSERFKKIEQILISTLKTLPAETQANFFELYERELNA